MEKQKKLNSKTFDLKTGSIVLLSGGSRLYYHSVSKFLKTEKNFLHNENPNIFPRNSRLSITLRRFKEKVNCQNYAFSLAFLFLSGPIETTTMAGLNNLSPIMNPFCISSTILPSGTFSL